MKLHVQGQQISTRVGYRGHSSYATPTVISRWIYIPQSVLIGRPGCLPLVPPVTPLQTSQPAPRTSEFQKTDTGVPPSSWQGPWCEGVLFRGWGGRASQRSKSRARPRQNRPRYCHTIISSAESNRSHRVKNKQKQIGHKRHADDGRRERSKQQVTWGLTQQVAHADRQDVRSCRQHALAPILKRQPSRVLLGPLADRARRAVERLGLRRHGIHAGLQRLQLLAALTQRAHCLAAH